MAFHLFLESDMPVGAFRLLKADILMVYRARKAIQGKNKVRRPLYRGRLPLDHDYLIEEAAFRQFDRKRQIPPGAGSGMEAMIRQR